MSEGQQRCEVCHNHYSVVLLYPVVLHIGQARYAHSRYGSVPSEVRLEDGDLSKCK